MIPHSSRRGERLYEVQLDRDREQSAVMRGRSSFHMKVCGSCGLLLATFQFTPTTHLGHNQPFHPCHIVDLPPCLHKDALTTVSPAPPTWKQREAEMTDWMLDALQHDSRRYSPADVTDYLLKRD